MSSCMSCGQSIMDGHTCDSCERRQIDGITGKYKAQIAALTKERDEAQAKVEAILRDRAQIFDQLAEAWGEIDRHTRENEELKAQLGLKELQSRNTVEAVYRQRDMAIQRADAAQAQLAEARELLRDLIDNGRIKGDKGSPAHRRISAFLAKIEKGEA